jgi:hypothetical protein
MIAALPCRASTCLAFCSAASARVSLTYGLELLDRASTAWAAITACLAGDYCWAHLRCVTSFRSTEEPLIALGALGIPPMR